MQRGALHALRAGELRRGHGSRCEGLFVRVGPFACFGVRCGQSEEG